MTMMMTMPALFGVGTLPTARAITVSEGENATEGARHEVNGLVVMTTDCDTLVLGERKSALVKDVKRTTAVAAPILSACLAEVVEEGGDSYALGRYAARVCGYVLINLKRMLSKSTILLMVTVAPAFEVVGGLKVCDDGFDAGAPGGAEDAEDTFSGVAHVRYVLLFIPDSCTFLTGDRRNLLRLRASCTPRYHCPGVPSGDGP